MAQKCLFIAILYEKMSRVNKALGRPHTSPIVLYIVVKNIKVI